MVVFLYHFLLILGVETTSPWQLYTLRLGASTRAIERPATQLDRATIDQQLPAMADDLEPAEFNCAETSGNRACCCIVGPRFRTFHNEGNRGKGREGNLVYDPLHTHGPLEAGRERQDGVFTKRPPNDHDSGWAWIAHCALRGAP